MNISLMKYDDWCTHKLYVKLWSKEGLIYDTHNSFMIVTNIRGLHEHNSMKYITKQLNDLNIPYQHLIAEYNIQILKFNNDNDLVMAKLIS